VSATSFVAATLLPQLVLVLVVLVATAADAGGAGGYRC
jgi:hypothetical protein